MKLVSTSMERRVFLETFGAGVPWRHHCLVLRGGARRVDATEQRPPRW